MRLQKNGQRSLESIKKKYMNRVNFANTAFFHCKPPYSLYRPEAKRYRLENM